MRTFAAAAMIAALTTPYAFSQSACRAAHETTLTGAVRDSTQALIPGASLTLDGGPAVSTGADGRFHFPCVTAGQHHLVATAEGFEASDVAIKVPQQAELRVVLQPESVRIDVNVNADEQSVDDPNKAGPSTTISGRQLQSLADDPDDLLRELQQLGAAGGGGAAATTISVDGFQTSTKLPPKSSIAYIKVNPDQFSAEYREPPFDGGRVEVYTKPGAEELSRCAVCNQWKPMDERARSVFGEQGGAGQTAVRI